MSKADQIRDMATAAVVAAVHNPAVDASPTAALPIAEAVVRQVVPTVLHETNNEPWYQSRVTIGAIVSIAIPLLGLFGVSTDVINGDELTAILLAAGSAVGGAITLYGRWKARKPIGS